MLAAARKEPSAVLLFAQIAAVLLYPFLEDSDAGQAYDDLVSRYLGEDLPHRFLEVEKKGFFGRLFGG